MKTKKSFLSHLLPYDASTKTNGSLRSGLKECHFLLRAFHEAVHFWGQGSLEKFDSLVGENACQIRAIWIASLASKNFHLEHLSIKISNSLAKIDSLLKPQTLDSLMRSGESLETLLRKEEIDLPLDADEMLILKSYLLSEMKIVRDHSLYRIETADPKLVKRLGEISSSFAGSLLSRLRKLLAYGSVHFIRDQALIHQDQSLMRMVNGQFTQHHNTLPCIPMFWTYKTVLRTAQTQQIPLVLHVKFLKKNAEGYEVIGEDSIFYKSGNASYTAMHPDEQDLNKPVFIVQGIAIGVQCPKQWKEQINQRSIEEVILAGAAHHRQYPDQAHDSLISTLNDSEYENYKALAEKEGFSDVNPSRFFIQHVYASRAEHALEKISLRKKQLIAENLFSKKLLGTHRNTSQTPIPAAISTSSRGA